MDWFALVKDLGVPLGFAVIAVWAFVTGRVVPRWLYDELKADRDAWRSLSKEVTSDLEKATRITNTAVRKVVKG